MGKFIVSKLTDHRLTTRMAFRHLQLCGFCVILKVWACSLASPSCPQQFLIFFLFFFFSGYGRTFGNSKSPCLLKHRTFFWASALLLPCASAVARNRHLRVPGQSPAFLQQQRNGESVLHLGAYKKLSHDDFQNHLEYSVTFNSCRQLSTSLFQSLRS